MNYTSKQEKALRARVVGDAERTPIFTQIGVYISPVGRIPYTDVGVFYMENLCHCNASGGKRGRKGTCDEDLDGHGMAL